MQARTTSSGASANTRTILRLLLESKIDVALVEGPVSHPRVDVVPWREDELVVIAHPEDRFARRASYRRHPQIASDNGLNGGDRGYG